MGSIRRLTRYVPSLAQIFDALRLLLKTQLNKKNTSTTKQKTDHSIAAKL